MSDASKAVFLSYASQDAEAAKRICDALRAAGVEVWFDQNELVGGDAWDAKIRKQIKDCALLIPVISAATQGRREAYFRLEWKLADERTHLMAKGTPFILPVTIDTTNDRDALVPDSFLAVQWTKLPGGEGGAAFAARVKKSLGGSEMEPGRPRPGIETRGEVAAPPTKYPRSWLLPAIIGLVVVAAGGVWLVRQPPPAAVTVTPPATLTPAAAELARIRARIIPDRWQREDFAAVSATLDRRIQDNPEESDAWALRSIINSLQVVRNFDAGTRPLEAGKTDADRALRLAPGSPLAEIAFGLHLVAMTSRGGDAAACRSYIDRGVAALPPDGLTRYAELVSHWFGYEFEDVRRVALAWLAVEPQASFPAWILSQSCFVQRQPEEAEKWAEQASVDSGITGLRAHYTRFESRYYLQADLRGARQALEKIPPAGRTVHRVVHAYWLVAMVERRWDDALQELARVPEPLLFDRAYHGPKSLLAGLAHLRAGRPEAAAAQFREAERLLREQLAADPDNEALHGVLAVTLACGGRGAEARNELAVIEPLVKRRPATLQRGSLALLIAHTYAILGDFRSLAFWLRLLLAEPSQFSFTPAALRFDPRFTGAVDAPEIRALLKEFAALDQPVVQRTEDGGQKTAQMVDQKSIAVLPFANMSDDKDATAFFADGVHEDILTSLVSIRDLRVVSRTSVMDYRGTKKKIPEIGRELHVAYVLEGSVRRAGNKVRVTGQLIKAATDEHVWAKSYDRDLTDIFAIQAELAQTIATELDAVLSPREQKLLAERPTTNLAAYDLYLKAREINTRGGRAGYEDVARRVTMAEGAVALDPKFAQAWAELAEAHVGMFSSSLDTTPARLTKARAALDRARALAPASPVVLRAVGVYHMLADLDGAKAIEQFERILAVQPNDVDCLMNLGTAQRLIGRWLDAIRTARTRMNLEPGNPVHARDLVGLLTVVRRYDEARAELAQMKGDSDEKEQWVARLAFYATGSRVAQDDFYARLEARSPDSPLLLVEKARRARERGDYAEHGRLHAQRTGLGTFDRELMVTILQGWAMKRSGDAARARQRLGDWPASLRARLELEPDNTQWLRGLASVAAILGNHEEALRCINYAADLMPFEKDSQRAASIREIRAEIYADRGDKVRAVAQLAELLRHPTPFLNVHGLADDPRYAALRGDPGFEALLRDPKNNEPLF